MEYGLIYLKIVPLEKNLEWIKYCKIYNSFPLDLQKGLKQVVKSVNNQYKDDMIIPLGLDAEVGCLVKPERTRPIAETLFGMYSVMLHSLGLQPNVRIVYSIGEIQDTNKKSVHRLYNDDVVKKVGRFLDKSDESGIFEI